MPPDVIDIMTQGYRLIVTGTLSSCDNGIDLVERDLTLGGRSLSDVGRELIKLGIPVKWPGATLRSMFIKFKFVIIFSRNISFCKRLFCDIYS